MRPQHSNLPTALDKMVDNEEVIPVLDKDGKIIGDLTLNRVLSAFHNKQLDIPSEPCKTRQEILINDKETGKMHVM